MKKRNVSNERMCFSQEKREREREIQLKATKEFVEFLMYTNLKLAFMFSCTLNVLPE